VAGKEVLVLVWDNASWHVSKEVHRWIGEHNRGAKKGAAGKDWSGDLAQPAGLHLVDEAAHAVLVGDERASLNAPHRLAHVLLKVGE
jgi:hypothetical protein